VGVLLGGTLMVFAAIVEGFIGVSAEWGAGGCGEAVESGGVVRVCC